MQRPARNDSATAQADVIAVKKEQSKQVIEIQEAGRNASTALDMAQSATADAKGAIAHQEEQDATLEHFQKLHCKDMAQYFVPETRTCEFSDGAHLGARRMELPKDEEIKINYKTQLIAMNTAVKNAYKLRVTKTYTWSCVVEVMGNVPEDDVIDDIPSDDKGNTPSSCKWLDPSLYR